MEIFKSQRKQSQKITGQITHSNAQYSLYREISLQYLIAHFNKMNHISAKSQTFLDVIPLKTGGSGKLLFVFNLFDIIPAGEKKQKKIQQSSPVFNFTQINKKPILCTETG